MVNLGLWKTKVTSASRLNIIFPAFRDSTVVDIIPRWVADAMVWPLCQLIIIDERYLRQNVLCDSHYNLYSLQLGEASLHIPATEGQVLLVCVPRSSTCNDEVQRHEIIANILWAAGRGQIAHFISSVVLNEKWSVYFWAVFIGKWETGTRTWPKGLRSTIPDAFTKGSRREPDPIRCSTILNSNLIWVGKLLTRWISNTTDVRTE